MPETYTIQCIYSLAIRMHGGWCHLRTYACVLVTTARKNLFHALRLRASETGQTTTNFPFQQPATASCVWRRGWTNGRHDYIRCYATKPLMLARRRGRSRLLPDTVTLLFFGITFSMYVVPVNSFPFVSLLHLSTLVHQLILLIHYVTNPTIQNDLMSCI